VDDSFASSGSEAPPPYLGASQPPGISERMQALMSRAEQEIAEQRQLQQLVNDVRASLGQLSEEIRGVAGAHTLEIVRGEVTGLGSEIRASTTMLGERLEAVVRAVGAGAQVMQGVGQQLDRITELLNHQQQQIAGLTAAVAQQRDALGALPESVAARAAAPVAEVREHVSGISSSVSSVSSEVAAVREHVGGVSGDVAAVRQDVASLRERLDGVVGEVRDDAAATLRALGDRIDTAVIALAEALLRPRGAALVAAERDEGEDVPTTATMTVPVVAATPPWAGAASTVAADEAADEPVQPEAAAEEPAEEEPADEANDVAAGFDAQVPALAPDGDTAADDMSDDDADEAAWADTAAAEGVAEALAGEPEAVPEPATDEDDEDDDEDDEDDDEDDDETTEEPPEGAPAADTAEATVADPVEPGEVPLDSWPSDAPGAPEPEPEASAESGEPASAWGWDGPNAPGADAGTEDGPAPEGGPDGEEPDQREKRRPWWRPGG
jgi:phage shock protein A